METDLQIKKVMATLFGIDEELITDELSPETLSAWDSLKHMDLILSLEQTFKIKIPDEDAFDMFSFEEVSETVKKLLENKA